MAEVETEAEAGLVPQVWGWVEELESASLELSNVSHQPEQNTRHSMCRLSREFTNRMFGLNTVIYISETELRSRMWKILFRAMIDSFYFVTELQLFKY